MRLYLMRHGEALSAGDDASRPLSEKGRKEAAYSSRLAVEEKSMAVSRILHSPKIRALETAEILSRAFNTSPAVVESDDLLPHDDPLAWTSRLQQEQEDIALVGHLPFLANLAETLLQGRVSKQIRFHTAQIIHLERNEEGIWQYRWSVQAE